MSHHVISTILRHDSKQTSYKIALLRALNDVVLAHPDLRHEQRSIAVPLRILAEAWIAYYWPFVEPEQPIDQGVRTLRSDTKRNDLGFRPHLSELRRAWEEIYGDSGPAGGWLVIDHMRSPRKREGYPAQFLKLYRATLRQIARAIEQPIRYAGEGTWSLFARPRPRAELEGVAAIPGTTPRDRCVVVPAELWSAFREVSLWVEALCIHEWSLFTERITEGVGRGRAYTLLTERPHNRLPLTWERNRIDLLMDEGAVFVCPWTGKRLGRDAYQLDHIVPIAVHPFNELWNLVPADPRFNMHAKRARLPGATALQTATPRLIRTYDGYETSGELARALHDDVALRFSRPDTSPSGIVRAVRDLVESIAEARNVARF